MKQILSISGQSNCWLVKVKALDPMKVAKLHWVKRCVTVSAVFPHVMHVFTYCHPFTWSLPCIAIHALIFDILGFLFAIAIPRWKSVVMIFGAAMCNTIWPYIGFLNLPSKLIRLALTIVFKVSLRRQGAAWLYGISSPCSNAERCPPKFSGDAMASSWVACFFFFFLK